MAELVSVPAPCVVVGREPLRVPCCRAPEEGHVSHGGSISLHLAGSSKPVPSVLAELVLVLDTSSPSTSLLSKVPGHHRDQNSLIKSRTLRCSSPLSISVQSTYYVTLDKRPIIMLHNMSMTPDCPPLYR